MKELVHHQGEVLSEFVQEKLATAGEKFHDVVHEIVSNKVVFQGIRVAVFLGTPVGLITWIILAYFSSVFLREVTRSTRRRSGHARRGAPLRGAQLGLPGTEKLASRACRVSFCTVSAS